MPGADASPGESTTGESTSQSVLLLAGAPDLLTAQAPLVRQLRDLGHRVRWAYAEGRLPGRAKRTTGTGDRGTGARSTGDRSTGTRGTGDRGTGDRSTGERGAADHGDPHRLVAARTPSRPHQAVLVVAPRVVGTTRRVALAARFDPWFRAAVREADHLVVLDEAARAGVEVAHGLGESPTVHVGEAALAELVEGLTVAHVRTLVQVAHEELTQVAPAAPATSIAPAEFAGLISALDALVEAAHARAALPDPRTIDLEPRAVPLRSLPQLTREPGQVLEVVARLLPVLGPTDPVLAAHRARAELDGNGRTAADPVGVAVALLETVDPLLSTGHDPGHDVAELVCLALDLVFHRELHSDSLDSPLVRDPAGHLERLRGTRTWQWLTSAPHHGARTGATAQRTAAQRTPARVLVLPGAYGTFFRPLLETLQVSAAVKVRLVERRLLRPHLRTMGTSAPVVRERLRAAAGLPVSGYPELQALVSRWRPDVLVVDWADKTAVLATLLAPTDTRIVLRVHGVDALRPWIHLLDWERVDALISVSTPLLDLVRDVIGEPARTTRAHVIPHLIDLDRFDAVADREPRGVTDARRPEGVREPHTLCLVGWAQRVKDPLWAVELLASLRADGADWRLLLVGADFAAAPTASGAVHAEAFRSRAMADDVRDHIEFTGYIEDLPSVLARAGFVLSTSLRETWHVGAAEAVAAGAVPVIRDWPMLSSRGGARAVYPPEWVVDTAEQALERIRSLADPAARAAAARAAGAQLREITDPVRIRSELRTVALGDLGRLADLSERREHDQATALVRELIEAPSPSPAVLQQAAISATLAGELTLRLDVLRRWVEVEPRGRVQQLVRQQEGRLRELDTEWLPAVAGADAEAAARADVPDQSDHSGDPVDPVPGRVLHVLKVSLPHRQSGYALRSFYLLREQARAGQDVLAVTALDFPATPADHLAGENQLAEETVGGVRHLRLLREHIPRPEHSDDYLSTFAAALLRVVRQERPAIIHAHSGHRGYDIARVALAVGAATGVPVVYEVRGFFEALWTPDLRRAEHAEIYRLRRLVETDSMRRAAAVTTLSESMRAEIIDRGIDSDRVLVVGNGVDPGAVVPREPRADLIETLGLRGAFVFGYISNLDHEREGHELLVGAVRGLHEAGVPAKVLIVGGGSRLPELRRLAQQLGVADRVVFTDQVPHEEVADYYALLDVFVVPRVDERAARLVTPLKPYEAMAMRLPLVVSALPALLEIIGDGQRGASFPVGDAEGLSGVLIELARDPQRRQVLAERGRQWVLEQRTWETLAAHYQQLYAEVLADQDGAGS